MNNNGNVLINTFVSLLLISILIFSVTKGVSQSAELSEHTFERDLLESLMDEVVEDFVPIVNERFYATDLDPVFFVNFNGAEAHSTFAPHLDELMLNIDNAQYLSCSSVETYSSAWDYIYEVQCEPPGSEVQYVISFDVSKTHQEDGDHYFIMGYEYFTRPLPTP